MLVGFPGADRSTFPAGLARRKGLTLVVVRRMKEMYGRTIRLVSDGRVDVRTLVSAAHPLPRAAEAFDAASARTGLKVVVSLADGA